MKGEVLGSRSKCIFGKWKIKISVSSSALDGGGASKHHILFFFEICSV